MKPYKKDITAIRRASFALLKYGFGCRCDIQDVPFNHPRFGDIWDGCYIADKQLRDRAEPGEIYSLSIFDTQPFDSLAGHTYMLVPTRELAAEHPPEYWVSTSSAELSELADKHDLPDPFEVE